MSYEFLFKDYMQQETYLFITINAPHRKEMGETVFSSFFTGIGGDAPRAIQGW